MAFALPFSPQLWGLIVVVVVVTAFLDYWMRGHSHKSLTTYVYYAMMTITTKSKFEPLTRRSKLLNYGLAFFSFVVTAAYIANLSNVLLTTNVFVPTYSSIDDADARGARVCVEAGSAFQTMLLKYYHGIKVVGLPTAQPPSSGIASGHCDAAAVPSVIWDLGQETADSNPSCNYVQAGSVIRILNGAWPYKVDYNEKCTSFVNAVVTSILVQLYSTGEINTVYSDAVDSQFNVTCSFEPPEEEKPPLSYENVGGVFVIYILLVGSGVLLHVSKKVYAKYIPDKRERAYVEHDRQEQGEHLDQGEENEHGQEP